MMSATPPPPPSPPPSKPPKPLRTDSANEPMEGAATSTHALGTSKEGDARKFPCPQCGADLTFHIGDQTLKCPFCTFKKELTAPEDRKIEEQDYVAMLQRLAKRRTEKGRKTEGDISEVKCTACAATVQFTGTLTTGECPYCGVPLQRSEIHVAEDRIPVDGVLPFQIDRQKARENLTEWIKSRWFAPNAFKKRGVQGKFSGVYLPYWTFDSLTFNKYSGLRGEYYYVTVGSGKNRRTVRKTRWYPASGSFQRFFDDVLVIAGQGLPRERLYDLEPWPLKKCTPFNQEVLAGLLARTYDLTLDGGFEEAKGLMSSAIREEVLQRIGGDTQKIHSVYTSHEGVSFKHLLLPVWMLTYRYKNKPYQVVVNAGTGEVQGDRPYSWIKITLAVLAGLAVAAAAVWLFQR